MRLCSLAVCPADDGIAVLTDGGQLLQLAAASGDRRGLFAGVQPLAPGFHSGAVVGLATCARRAVVATAGADRTIRMWDYLDRSAELVGAGPISTAAIMNDDYACAHGLRRLATVGSPCGLALASYNIPVPPAAALRAAAEHHKVPATWAQCSVACSAGGPPGLAGCARCPRRPECPPLSPSGSAV